MTSMGWWRCTRICSRGRGREAPRHAHRLRSAAPAWRCHRLRSPRALPAPRGQGSEGNRPRLRRHRGLPPPCRGCVCASRAPFAAPRPRPPGVCQQTRAYRGFHATPPAEVGGGPSSSRIARLRPATPQSPSTNRHGGRLIRDESAQAPSPHCRFRDQQHSAPDRPPGGALRQGQPARTGGGEQPRRGGAPARRGSSRAARTGRERPRGQEPPRAERGARRTREPRRPPTP
jgi:hypothetical protein